MMQNTLHILLLNQWAMPLGLLIGLIVFILGAVAGSFAGVVVTRLPLSLLAHAHDVQSSDPNVLGSYTTPTLAYPRSHCWHCSTQLRVIHTIPLISYLLLKGECSYCKKPIGFSLFAIELLSALWWTFCFLQYELSGAFLVFCVYGSALLCLAFIDGQTQLLPDAITQPLLWAGLITSSIGVGNLSLNLSLFGAVLGYCVLWIISRAYLIIKGEVGLGDGDLKLVAAIGAWIGPFALIALILIASLSGILAALILRFKEKMNPGDYIPFGPFLVASALLIQALLSPNYYHLLIGKLGGF